MEKQRKVSETKPQFAIFDYIVSLPVIRILKPLYEWNRGFWIYCFLGFLSTASDTIINVELAKIIPSASISSIIAWSISTIFAFVLFRYLYFDRTNNSFINEFLRFVPTRLFTLGLGYVIILVFVDIMKYNLLLIKIISIPITAIANYITSKLFVFK